MAGVLAEARKGGVKPDERAALERAMARFKDHFDGDPGKQLPSAFETGARPLYNQFLRSASKDPSDTYNHRLPSTRADAGNRLGQGKPTCGKEFPVTGKPTVVDGTGGSRGTLESSKVQINYGQKKFINGEWYVYGFAFRLKNAAGQSVPASGWLPEKSIPSPEVRQMGIVDALRAPDNKAGKVFQIAGASASRYPANAKIVKNPDPREGNAAPGDYLTRPGGVVNILYATPGHGGVSNDTLPVGQGVKFVPSDVKPQQVVVYVPDGAGKGGYRDSGIRQEFIYGRSVGADGSSRYGWICKDNLQAA